MARPLTLLPAAALVLAGCGASSASSPSGARDSGVQEENDANAFAGEGGASADAGVGATADAGVSADTGAGPRTDAGMGADAGADAGTGADADTGDGGSTASRFVTGVVQFTPTDCTGFGKSAMPGIVEGPPVGGGTALGSTDVVSLGSGGSIIVTFAPNAIIDGPGPDFIVFENPFWIGGDSSDIYAEPGQVSVSDDGETWTPFPCTPTVDPSATDGTGTAPPYGTCGGWGVVYSTPQNGISPFDPTTAGGNAFDLATIGVTHARFVKIVDQTHEPCPDAGGPTTNGFDLDAIAIVNAELP